MTQNKYLQEIISSRPEYVDIFVDNSYDLAERIYFLMKLRGIDQKKLAQLLGKNESEISKWLSGTHNFTFKTTAKIESALKGKLFQVCENIECDSESNGAVVLNYKSASFNIFDSEYVFMSEETKKGSNLKNFHKYTEARNINIPSEILIS